jgi:hypothetical protein
MVTNDWKSKILFNLVYLMQNLLFLPACHAAAADIVGIPEASIHLARGLQFSGF